MTEPVKFVEKKTARNGPLCYHCGGRMIKRTDLETKTWQCPDCESKFIQGYLNPIVQKNISDELKSLDKAKVSKHGGGSKSGRKRKKQVSKHRFYRIDAG